RGNRIPDAGRDCTLPCTACASPPLILRKIPSRLLYNGAAMSVRFTRRRSNSIAQLGHTRQHEVLEVGRAVDVAQAFERGDQRAHLRLRNLAGGFEEGVLVQEIVGL